MWGQSKPIYISGAIICWGDISLFGMTNIVSNTLWLSEKLKRSINDGLAFSKLLGYDFEIKLKLGTAFLVTLL